MGVKFQAGYRSEVGMVRSVNQDNGLVTRRLFAVADGMGGHAAGEVAARLAVETLQSEPVASADDLLQRVYTANEVIFTRSFSEAGMRGMGTTLCTVAAVGADGADRLLVTNVGDSRVYLLQDGKLRQITRDHSFVEDLVDAGEITHEEARTHPNRNIVTRALGIEPYVEVDHWELFPFAGDRYLLCSDGLYNEVDDRHLTEALRSIDNPQECADVLVRLANESGGRDNITVLVVDVVAVDVDDSLESLDDTGPITAPMPTGGWLDEVHELNDPAATEPVTPIVPRIEPDPEPPKPRRKRLTWRVAIFAVLLAALFVAPIFIMRAWAGAGYTVTVDANDEIVLLKGRPGGILWFEPDFVSDFDGLTLDDVLDKDRPRVIDGQHYANRADAERYVANLKEQAEAANPTTTTTTRPPTTTTTRPATSTTTRPPATTTTAPATTLGP